MKRCNACLGEREHLSWCPTAKVFKLNEKPKLRYQDYDRSAERRYETWLEEIKDHGP